MTQIAVSRNSRQLQFDAVEAATASSLNEEGEARASPVGQGLSDGSKTEAKRLFADRESREEQIAGGRRRADDYFPAFNMPGIPAPRKKKRDEDVAKP